MREDQIKCRFVLMEWTLDERLRRLVAAAEAKVLGHGGITAVAAATGGSRRAIHAGIKISHTQVGKLLAELGYSLQANKKTLEGTTHPDRNAQFEYINSQVSARLLAQKAGLFVDTKKKELVRWVQNK